MRKLINVLIQERMTTMVNKLLNYIEENKQDLYEILCDYIRINTENKITSGTE